LFGGEVDGFYFTVEGYGAVEVEGEGGGAAIARLLLGAGEAGPAGAEAEDDLVFSEFQDCEVVAVEAVGGCVGAEQGGPGDPEFGVEFILR